MNDNVRQFPKTHKAPPPAEPKAYEPDANAVELLERLLEQAKTGELQGIAVLWGNAAGDAWHTVVTSDAFDGALVVGRLRIFLDDLSERLRGE